MEEKKQEQRPQYFYFNDDGKLVVESNKCVWVDGEQYVKMYGNFTCNAKTMGVIISQLKGIHVGVAEYRVITREDAKWYDFDKTHDNSKFIFDCFCILGLSEEDVRLHQEKLAEKNYTNISIDRAKEIAQQKVDKCQSEINTFKKAYSSLRDKVIAFNDLPWYKRMFKKIEIKTN